MASGKDYRDFILEQLSDLRPTYRAMMGEFLIYVNGVYFGGVYDDRFLVKKLPQTKSTGLRKNCLTTGQSLCI